MSRIGKIKGVIKQTCSRCENKLESKSRYCKKCKNAYMKEWRKTHILSDLARFKGIVRSKTKMRIKRGLLIKMPCEKCGSKEVQAHHVNYDEPYNVMWLCVIHHREIHKSI